MIRTRGGADRSAIGRALNCFQARKLASQVHRVEAQVAKIAPNQ
jgi:hypothetical protein